MFDEKNAITGTGLHIPITYAVDNLFVFQNVSVRRASISENFIQQHAETIYVRGSWKMAMHQRLRREPSHWKIHVSRLGYKERSVKGAIAVICRVWWPKKCIIDYINKQIQWSRIMIYPMESTNQKINRYPLDKYQPNLSSYPDLSIGYWLARPHFESFLHFKLFPWNFPVTFDVVKNLVLCSSGMHKLYLTRLFIAQNIHWELH